MNITCVTIDCEDPRRTAEFWNEALHWTGVVDLEDDNIVVCRPPDAGAYLEFVRVPDAKQVKNRVHLGCNAGSIAAMDLEIDRLVGLGATIAWEEEFPPEVAGRYRNVVMHDVEGNEFCLGAGTSLPD